MNHPPFKGGQGRSTRAVLDAVDALSTMLAIVLVAAVVGACLMVVS